MTLGLPVDMEKRVKIQVATFVVVVGTLLHQRCAIAEETIDQLIPSSMVLGSRLRSTDHVSMAGLYSSSSNPNVHAIACLARCMVGGTHRKYSLNVPSHSGVEFTTRTITNGSST